MHTASLIECTLYGMHWSLWTQECTHVLCTREGTLHKNLDTAQESEHAYCAHNIADRVHSIWNALNMLNRMHCAAIYYCNCTLNPKVDTRIVHKRGNSAQELGHCTGKWSCAVHTTSPTECTLYGMHWTHWTECAALYAPWTQECTHVWSQVHVPCYMECIEYCTAHNAIEAKSAHVQCTRGAHFATIHDCVLTESTLNGMHSIVHHALWTQEQKNLYTALWQAEGEHVLCTKHHW